MSGPRHLRRAALAVLAMAGVAGGPVIAQPPGRLDIRVIMSPGAGRELASRSEAIIVAAFFYGDPAPHARRYADETGRIALHRREEALPAAGGTARFALGQIPARARARVRGPLLVNVNVYSARRSSPDNLLSCDFMDGPVPGTRRMPVTLHCALIVEGTTSRYVS